MSGLSYWNEKNERFEFKKNILYGKKTIEFLIELLSKKNSGNKEFQKNIMSIIYCQFGNKALNIKNSSEINVNKSILFIPNKKEYVLELSKIINEVSKFLKNIDSSFTSFLSSKGNHNPSFDQLNDEENIDREIDFLTQIKNPIDWFERFLNKFVFSNWKNKNLVDEYLIERFDIMKIHFSNEEWNINFNSFSGSDFDYINSEFKKGNYRNAMAKARQLLGKHIGNLNKNEDFQYFSRNNNSIPIYKYADNILKEISNIRHYIEKEDINDENFENLKDDEKKIVAKFVIESANLLKSLVDSERRSNE